MLKIGLSLYSFGFVRLPSFNMFFKFCVEKMRKYGIVYFELPVWNSFSVEEAKQIKQLLHPNIKCYSVHLPKCYSAKEILLNSNLLKGVIALQPSVAVFHPQTESDLSKDYFRLSHLFQNIGCKLSVEFLAYDKSLQKAFETIDKSVAITLDLYHCVNAGYSIEQIISRFSSSIAHIHLNDFSESAGKSLCPGNGSLPIGSYINMLQEQDYDGVYMLECNFANAEHFQKILTTICDGLE